MGPLSSDVFFYGLFMDAAVLEAKGISSPGGRPGVVRDWRSGSATGRHWSQTRGAPCMVP